MIRINLLPPEVHTSERRINPNYAIALVGGGLVIFLLPLSWAQYSKRKTLRDEVGSLNSELERYKPIVAQVEILEQAKMQLQQRKGIIQQLENERLRYPHFMEDFIKLLPNNVWLTGLTTSLPADGASISVSMDLIALDHYAVADMVSNLETSQIFNDVDLGTLSLNQSQTAQSVTFHINTVYKKAAVIANAPKRS